MTFGPGSVRVDIANDGNIRPVTLIETLPAGQMPCNCRVWLFGIQVELKSIDFS